VAVLYALDWPDNDAHSREVLRAAMWDMVQIVYAEAEERVPVGTTKTLSKSLGARVERSGDRGIIYARARHAYLVHEGAAAHAIPRPDKPRKSKHLAIPTAGGVIFRQSAQHPGSKGRPFLKEALESSRAAVERVLRDKGESYVEGAL
jgi:hypothetical protein